MAERGRPKVSFKNAHLARSPHLAGSRAGGVVKEHPVTARVPSGHVLKQREMTQQSSASRGEDSKHADMDAHQVECIAAFAKAHCARTFFVVSPINSSLLT